MKTPLQILRSQGVKVALVGDAVEVDVAALSFDRYERAFAYAMKNRDRIIKEVRDEGVRDEKHGND